MTLDVPGLRGAFTPTFLLNQSSERNFAKFTGKSRKVLIIPFQMDKRKANQVRKLFAGEKPKQKKKENVVN